MTRPVDWLARFFQERELRSPDGRMLYAYRLNSAEFASLQEVLRVSLSDSVLSSSGHLSAGASECLVLYGAAWWQRAYQGGAWAWSDVFASFGCNGDSWTPQFRTQCVRIGMDFWRLQIGTSRKKYFGVLVEQGGLPAVLLAKAKGGISALLRQLLKRAARLGAETDEIAVMAADFNDRLPGPLQNETVHQLLASMVRALLDLKREFRLDLGDNAVEKLDRLCPGWRERFPIPLDAGPAETLLRELIGDTAKLELQTRAAALVADRFLVCEDGVWSVFSRAEFPKTIDAGEIAAMSGADAVDAADLPFNFSAELALDRVYTAAAVRRVFGPPPVRYQFSVVRSRWNGAPALCAHVLQIALPGSKQIRAPVPGGMELDTAAPWVFVSSGEECRFIAQGSARIRQDHAFIVADPHWNIETSGTGAAIEKLGVFMPGTVNRVVLRVNADTVISDGQNIYRIRLMQTGAEQDRLVWEGHRFGFASVPGQAFYGVPRLYRYCPDGERIAVPPGELEWRVAGIARQIAAPATARGPVDVLWRSGGEVRLRSRLVLFDRTAALRFQSGSAIGEGMICIPAAWETCAVTCDTADVRAVTLPSQNDRCVALTCAGQPPEMVSMTLDWKGCPVACIIRVPFPASGAAFFNAEGERLADNAAVTSARLTGMRLRIFDTDPDHPRQYVLSLGIECRSLHSVAAGVRESEHIIALSDNRADLRLIDFQNEIDAFLSMTDALDAAATVTVLAGRRKVAAVRVTRYALALERDGAAVMVPPSAMGSLSSEALGEIRVMAVPVETMHRAEPVCLPQECSEGVPCGRWALPPQSALNHQWLVFPAAGSVRTFRPLLVDPLADARDGGTGTETPEGYRPAPETLQEILLVSAPGARRTLLVRHLTQMADDFTAGDWQIIEGLWTSLGHLALSSLDIWRALAASPPALTAFACRSWSAHGRDDVLDMCVRFQSELGVVWEAVPLSAWRRSCRSLSEQWQKVLPPELCSSLVPRQVADTLGGLKLYLPALQTMLAWITFEQTGLGAEAIAPLQRTKAPEYRRRLWEGPDCALQTILLRNHSEREAPKLGLYKDLLHDLECPDTMVEVLGTLLWRQDTGKTPLANMPLLLALCTCNDFLPQWWTDPRRLMELRQYRDFDRLWFGHAFDQAVAMFITAGFTGSTGTEDGIS